MTENTNYVTPEEAQTKWCPIQTPPASMCWDRVHGLAVET